MEKQEFRLVYMYGKGKERKGKKGKEREKKGKRMKEKENKREKTK